jgi:uncharacterized membrane protein
MDYGWESSGLLGLIVEGFRTQYDASGGWMTWNLMLATVPWLLSLIVFHPSRRTGVLWFGGAISCLVLLPNAPYILTDVVHLPPAVRREPSDTAVLLVVFPLYAALFAFAFAVYSDTLRRISRFAIARRWVSRAPAIELPLHAVCAVAIYVGRIHRLNSWDVAFQPLAVATRTLVGFTRPMALAGILLMFLALATAQTLTRTAVHMAGRWRPSRS